MGAGRGRLVRQLTARRVSSSRSRAARAGFVIASAGHASPALAESRHAAATRACLHRRHGAALRHGRLALHRAVAFGLIPALDGSRAELHAALESGGAPRTQQTMSGARSSSRRSPSRWSCWPVQDFSCAVSTRCSGSAWGSRSSHVLTAQLAVQGHQYDSLAAVEPVLQRGVRQAARDARGRSRRCGQRLTTHQRLDVRPDGRTPPCATGPTPRCPLHRHSRRVLRDTARPARPRPHVQCIRPPRPPDCGPHQSRPWPAISGPVKTPSANACVSGPNPSTPWETVVGVVGDMRYEGMVQDPVPTAFEFDEQSQWGSLAIAIRTTGDPAARGRRAARGDPRR